MKYLLLIVTTLISLRGFAADAVDNPGVSAGASSSTHANSAGASTSASYDSKGSASDGNQATITNTVETFKSPGMETRPRTTFNTGTDTQIDNDITDLNPPDVNQGVVTKPDVK